jgi:hypothetical protein
MILNPVNLGGEQANGHLGRPHSLIKQGRTPSKKIGQIEGKQLEFRAH